MKVCVEVLLLSVCIVCFLSYQPSIHPRAAEGKTGGVTKPKGKFNLERVSPIKIKNKIKKNIKNVHLLLDCGLS